MNRGLREGLKSSLASLREIAATTLQNATSVRNNSKLKTEIPLSELTSRERTVLRFIAGGEFNPVCNPLRANPALAQIGDGLLKRVSPFINVGSRLRIIYSASELSQRFYGEVDISDKSLSVLRIAFLWRMK